MDAQPYVLRSRDRIRGKLITRYGVNRVLVMHRSFERTFLSQLYQRHVA